MIINEHVLDKPKTAENQIFIIDQASNKIVIKKNALRNLVYPILNIAEQSGFSYDIIQIISAVGSSITPISKKDSTVDTVVGINTFNIENEFRQLSREGNKDNQILQAVATDPQIFMKIKYGEKPDINDLIKMFAKIVEDSLNGRRIFTAGEMRVNYMVMSQDEANKMLNDQNSFTMYENGKVMAKYISKKNYGYLDFSEEISPKQYFGDVVNELFKLHQIFKRFMTDLINDGKISQDSRDIFEYFKSMIEKIKKNRFNKKYLHQWIGKTGRPLSQDNFGRPIDKERTYNYMNVLYSHINGDLIKGSSTKKAVLDTIFKMVGEEDPQSVKEFAKSSFDQYGKFKPGAFLDGRVQMS